MCGVAAGYLGEHGGFRYFVYLSMQGSRYSKDLSQQAVLADLTPMYGHGAIIIFYLPTAVHGQADGLVVVSGSGYLEAKGAASRVVVETKIGLAASTPNARVSSSLKRFTCIHRSR